MKDLPDGQQVSLDFTLDHDDLYAMTQRVRYGRWGMRYAYVLPAFIVAWLIFFSDLYFFWFLVDSFAVIDAVLIVFVFLVAAWVLLPSTQRRWNRKSSSKFQKLPKKLQVVLDEEGVSTREPEGFSQISWSRFERAEETQSHFFLFMAPRCGVILPKRSLSNEEQAVHSLISRAISNFSRG